MNLEWIDILDRLGELEAAPSNFNFMDDVFACPDLKWVKDVYIPYYRRRLAALRLPQPKKGIRDCDNFSVKAWSLLRDCNMVNPVGQYEIAGGLFTYRVNADPEKPKHSVLCILTPEIHFFDGQPAIRDFVTPTPKELKTCSFILF